MLRIEWLESRVLLSALPSVATVPLDGTWQIQHTSADSIGGLSSSWSDVAIPSLLGRQAEAYAWYRKQINVPANWNDGHVFLTFDAVRYVSDVYINGVRVGGHFGGWEAFDLDITSYYTPGGSDQVLVRVQDIRGVFTDPSIPYDPNYDPNGSSGNNVLAPVGSQPGLYGIWQGVHLDYHRDVYIDNVAITTSVRQHEISATYTLINLTSSVRQVTLDPQVMDGSNSVLDFAPSTVTVPAGSTLQVTFSQPWANPQLWMPGSPHLYYLQASLNEVANALDTDSTRFGFREFWVSGTQFVLNGTPMNFLATAGHPDWTGRLSPMTRSARCSRAFARPMWWRCGCMPISGRRTGTKWPTRSGCRSCWSRRSGATPVPMPWTRGLLAECPRSLVGRDRDASQSPLGGDVQH